MKTGTIQVNGESWIEFPFYEILGLEIGFLFSERQIDGYRNDSLYRLNNGARFRIYQLGGDYSLLINDGDESLIREYVEFDISDEIKVSDSLRYYISLLFRSGAANYRVKLSKEGDKND
jgi:hypothetical protein